MARAAAAAAAADSDGPAPKRPPRARLRFTRLAARILDASAEVEPRGLLLRGDEFRPVRAEDLDAEVVVALLRLARLSENLVEVLRDCPDVAVRRSAAVLAARAHPLRIALENATP